MCGIVGYITTEDNVGMDAKDHFLRFALALDTLRGQDSTGLIAVRKDFDVYTAHTTMSGDEYINDKHYLDFTEEPAWAMIGHNRAATRGSVKLENAHPFEFGDITLVHNGTLHSGGKNMATFDEKLEVDSMQIALALSKVKPEEAKKVLEEIDGSFALVWTDARDESINICRNSNRPFHYCLNYAKTGMFFMSDGLHLHSILRSMSRSPLVGTDIYSLDKMKLVKFKKGKQLIPEVEEFRGYVPPKSITQAANPTWNGWRGNTTGRPGNTFPTPSSKGIGGDKALETYYELQSGTVVRFTPTSYMLSGNHATVYGEFVHPEWGDLGWDMAVRGIPKSLVQSAMTKDWTVEAVSLTHPTTAGSQMPAVLGRMLQPYWKEDTFTQCEKGPAPDEEVRGPEGEYCEKKALIKQMEDGCVQCGGNLKMDEIEDAIWVNEGRNILCKGCAEDWEKVTGAVA